MKRLIVVAVLAALAGAGISQLFASRPPTADTLLTSASPDKLRTRVTLKAPKSGEAIGFKVYPSMDAITAETLQSELLNGNTENTVYYPTGAIKSSEEFYPALKAGAERQLRYSTERALDGSFISDQSFRLDGTKIRVGRRLPDGLYEIFLYHDNGVAVWKHQLVAGQKEPVFEEGFYKTGATQSLTRINADNSGEVKTFYEDGKAESVTTFPVEKWNPIVSVFYFADGQNVRLRVSYQSLGSHAEYLRENGTLRMTFDEIFSTTGGTITWRFFDSEGNPQYEQVYFIEKKIVNGKEERVYRLRDATELNAAGEAMRKISFRGDGKTPDKVIISKPAGNAWGGTFKSFREDGTLEKIEERDVKGKVTAETAYTRTQGIKEIFPEKYLTMPSDSLPPPPLRTPAVRKAYSR
jgi:antitoxin component YwqK of YwqJK toxin-antitoxin module